MSNQGRSTSQTVAGRTALSTSEALGVLLLAASLPAAQTPTPSASVAKVAGPQIRIEHFQFTPTTVTVPVGTTVTWTNHDGMLHTVTSATRLFSTAGLEEGGVFSYTFTSPGSYIYYCTIHPHMTATVIVK